VKITGVNKVTRLFKLELVGHEGDYCHVQLEKEQFFFKETILKGSKLYKETEQKGRVLEIKQ
jgi:hypothetical protein